MELGKACILAGLIYEMTFFGFDETQVDRERKKLNEAIAELEKIRNLPSKEQEEIVNWLTKPEYDALSEDDKKDYAYFEWMHCSSGSVSGRFVTSPVVSMRIDTRQMNRCAC